MTDSYIVNGLRLPPLLISLLENGKWQHPGETVLLEAIPFLQVPVTFLASVEAMRSEYSGPTLIDIPRAAEIFYIVRGSNSRVPKDLPWLDVEKAIFIAINRELGDDVAIALDYRSTASDPRVVASEWVLTGKSGTHIWREVSATFSDFVGRIGLA